MLPSDLNSREFNTDNDDQKQIILRNGLILEVINYLRKEINFSLISNWKEYEEFLPGVIIIEAFNGILWNTNLMVFYEIRIQWYFMKYEFNGIL